MPKETSYQKTKRLLKESEERYNKLYSDFKKFYKGDCKIIATYSARFKMQDDFERVFWIGKKTSN